MSAVKKMRDVTFPYSYPDVFNATCDAARQGGIKVENADFNTGNIYMSTSISMWSWGENIHVTLYGDAYGTSMHIESDSAFPLTLYDWGYNLKNIDKIVNGVYTLLGNFYGR